MQPAIAYDESHSSLVNARILLSLMLLAAACLFADAVVGLRGIDVGTDTHVYAAYFVSLREGVGGTRFEPSFVLFTHALSSAGMSLHAYQASLFALMLLTVFVASRRYFDYLGSERGYLGFLVAALMWLFLSPTFVNGAINAVRQGVASMLVFTALLAFHRRQWRAFFVYGALAVSFHYSSLLYLACAPVLLLSERMLRLAAAAAFLAYCSGLTMLLVRTGVPVLYNMVMAYSPNAVYRAGVRLDFALFSIFWYLLPYVLGRLVREPFDRRIQHGAAIYLAELLPFFLIGWGNYSNRYLLPAWMSASLMLAAMCFHSRLAPLRNPVLLRGGLVVACGVFAYYVTHMVTL
ncbi:EpsG family protein [Frateuria defendens]|uniref:EpsG family protein n=1 Tax=Frateuria defendens TaxID=2219559 RepID=UPI00066FDB4C|nr:EpsG family protein [Frateuria defendens]